MAGDSFETNKCPCQEQHRERLPKPFPTWCMEEHPKGFSE